MRQGYRRLALRFTGWALDHPWGYATLFTCTFFTSWVLTDVAFGSAPVRVTVEAALLAVAPTVLFVRWLCATPFVRRRWERRAEEQLRRLQFPSG